VDRDAVGPALVAGPEGERGTASRPAQPYGGELDLRIEIHRVGGQPVIGAVGLGAGGELEEDIERDDLHGLAQAADDVGHLLDGVALADVHEEEIGARRVELDEFLEVGGGLVLRAVEGQVVVVAEEGLAVLQVEGARAAVAVDEAEDVRVFRVVAVEANIDPPGRLSRHHGQTAAGRRDRLFSLPARLRAGPEAFLRGP